MSNSAERRGSLWRKWDLQVHTPFSALNNGFGDDFDEYAKQFFSAAIAHEIAVVGVTDYFSIEGYSRLKALQANDQKLSELLGADKVSAAQAIVLLPNIEFRTSIVVSRPGGADSRVNFHVLFADDVSTKDIEEHFLRDLKFTDQSAPGSADNKRPLTMVNLAELGAKLRHHHPKFANRSDIYIGMMCAVVSHEDLTEVLTNNGKRFADRYVMIVPADEDLSNVSWDGQGHQMRKLLIQKSHMLFASNPKTRAWGLGQMHSSIDQFVAEFSSLKPCVHGSDAHAVDKLFRPALDRQLWVKADCTFQGLRQLLFEPESRAFIGDEPPELAALRDERAARTLKDIELTRLATARKGDKWFQDTVPLNPGLIAIIGNKGSGKSALADIIAHVGDCSAYAHYSFLTEERFLEPRARRGASFAATLRWVSGAVKSKPLGEARDKTAGERVKYIPQSYLEAICTDLKETTESIFYKELMDVIFSHVPQEERVGHHSLAELLDHLTEVRRQAIELLVNELRECNRTLLELQSRASSEYRKQLEFQLTQRNEELAAHERAKPAERPKPDVDPVIVAAQTQAAGLVAAAQGKVAAIEQEVAGHREKRAAALKQIAAADRLQSRLLNLERQFGTFAKDSAEDLAVLEIDLASVARLVVEREQIGRVRERATQTETAANRELAGELGGTAAARLSLAQGELLSARDALDADARKYDEYQQQLVIWQARKDELVGTADSAESVNGIQSRLRELAEIPRRISEITAQRDSIVDEIFAAKQGLLADYRRLYRAVQTFIDEHPVSQHSGQLQFSAQIAIEGFSDQLLEMLHAGKKGSFQGEQGRDRVTRLVRSADFTTSAGVRAFLAVIQDHLNRDHREASRKHTGLSTQVKAGTTEERVLGFLYGLEYLIPRFELRWMGKPLDQLSPGERGTLLLVFYLLIDQRRTPLIIDQPEENLDNQTVAMTLVPALRYAKALRQIVIVTHNPNLAVVCDADQVIHATIDKADGNRVTYTAGAIENPMITKLVVDVLEGTKPLFDKRDARYEVLERLRV